VRVNFYDDDGGGNLREGIAGAHTVGEGYENTLPKRDPPDKGASQAGKMAVMRVIRKAAGCRGKMNYMAR